jgi:hypothetical protein
VEWETYCKGFVRDKTTIVPTTGYEYKKYNGVYSPNERVIFVLGNGRN